MTSDYFATRGPRMRAQWNQKHIGGSILTKTAHG